VKGGVRAAAKPKDQISIAPVDNASPDMVEGQQILLACRERYAGLKSYTCTINIEDESHYPTGSFHQKGHARVFYKRPGKLRWEGKDSNGDAIVLICDGQRILDRSSIAGEQYQGPVAMLGAYGGVSICGTTFLPSFLLDLNWQQETFLLPNGSLLKALATKASMQGKETVGGRECHRVVCERAIATWTLFIDVEDYLVLRIDEDVSKSQMAEQRKLGGGGTSGKIASSHLSQLFNTEAVDTPIDERLFMMAD
jgi:outer membrane lipoprotein-sorting protein